MLIPVVTFAAVLAIVIGAYWLFVVQPEGRERSKLQRRLKSDEVRQKRISLERAPDKFSTIAPLNALLVRYSDSIKPLKQTLDDSGLGMTVSTLMLSCTVLGFTVAIVISYYVGLWWLALAGGVTAVYAPIWLVTAMRQRRIHKFEEQFPEAVELIARALRAGHAFPTGIQMVAEEMPAPAGPEFRLLFDRQNFGSPMADALRMFAERIPSLDARFFVTAVLTQRETGGNLSEVLDRLAAVMRERFKIKREVRVKSAHGRITATVLAALPPAMAGLVFMNDQTQMQMLFQHPLGFRLVMTGMVLEVIGILVIRRLVNIEY